MLASLGFYALAAEQHPAYLLGGLVCSFWLFLTGLRQSHNAQHYAIGLSRRGHEVVLFALSVLLQSSMHAVQITHLHHHRHCLGEDDIEASSSRLSWLRALYTGPLFIFNLHRHAFRLARTRSKKMWVVVELLTIAAWLTTVFFLLDIPALKIHAVVMVIGQCGTGFFAVWTVHHDCESEHHIARTQRGRLKNWISYNMFFHVEHHLFPAVPTCHLPELARRPAKCSDGNNSGTVLVTYWQMKQQI